MDAVQHQSHSSTHCTPSRALPDIHTVQPTPRRLAPSAFPAFPYHGDWLVSQSVAVRTYETRETATEMRYLRVKNLHEIDLDMVEVDVIENRHQRIPTTINLGQVAEQVNGYRRHTVFSVIN